MDSTEDEQPQQASHAESMKVEWFYLAGDKTCGPSTTEDIRRFIASGAISSDTFLFREGMTGWTKANLLPEFGSSTDAMATTPSAGSSKAFDHDKAKMAIDRSLRVALISVLILAVTGTVVGVAVIHHAKVVQARRSVAERTRAEEATRKAMEKEKQELLEQERRAAEAKRKNYEVRWPGDQIEVREMEFPDDNILHEYEFSRKTTTKKGGKIVGSTIETTWIISPINPNFFRITHQVRVLHLTHDRVLDNARRLAYPDTAYLGRPTGHLDNYTFYKQLVDRLKAEDSKFEEYVDYKESHEKLSDLTAFHFLTEDIDKLKGIFSKYREWCDTAQREHLAENIEKKIGDFPAAKVITPSLELEPVTFVTPRKIRVPPFDGSRAEMLDQTDVQSWLTLIAQIPEIDQAIAKYDRDKQAAKKEAKDRAARDAKNLSEEKARADAVLKN